MRSREVQQFLASITGRSIGEIDQRNRLARETMKIPSGPRGINAPHMSLEDGLIHILTLPSRRVNDALEVAFQLLGLRIVPHPEFPDLSEYFSNKKEGLGLLLLLAMRDGLSSTGFNIKSFELFETGEYAVMNFDRRSLKNLRFVFSGVKAHWEAPEEKRQEIYTSVERLAAANRFIIGTDHLKSLGDRIVADCPQEVRTDILSAASLDQASQ